MKTFRIVNDFLSYWQKEYDCFGPNKKKPSLLDNIKIISATPQLIKQLLLFFYF
jgi:hypothetical protein